ncbi:formate dehydrogenase accessory sulfurtransferase FdhD [Hyphomicrobium sp. CS1BSMeth3]|uniref:formate dehydrogenase accessory sulfurtransferase FdhD n=1 Tax=Hyphomicrobium sp. CS1BSMeth3 TaxID=1892844 RepID=UPI000931F294|nr:formate dehydrogenase accessory sulfurtransferase FdhD [Hyphomicrobium sp. CS1BSMeth3]
MTDAAIRARSIKVTATAVTAMERELPVEVPVALVYDGTTHAVMMASPTNLEDFALGFSLSEGIVSAPDEIEGVEVVEHAEGIELRMWLAKDRGLALAQRRRSITGPTGCGLCGIESLEAVTQRFPPVVSDVSFAAADIAEAMAALPAAQELNLRTRAVHAAGFWNREQGLVAVAEDVGRHNALDKLIGGLRRRGVDVRAGIILLTSRISVEMVQKTATAGAPMIVAVSAPTKLALETADAAGITLVAVARQDGFEVFTHPDRIPEAVTPPGKLGKRAKNAAA